METVKRKSGLKYREKIYVKGKAFRSPYFFKRADAVKWKEKHLKIRNMAQDIERDTKTITAIKKAFLEKL